MEYELIVTLMRRFITLQKDLHRSMESGTVAQYAVLMSGHY